MKSNNIKTILLICTITLAIAGSCIFISYRNYTKHLNTGSFNTLNITIDDYTIHINSKEKGHPAEESFFLTSFTIKHSDGLEYDYDVNYVDSILNLSPTPEFNISEQGNITINNKEFKYYVDDSTWNSILYYTLPDKKGCLAIKVTGRNVFNADGNQVKTKASIDKEVLSSKELAGIINFSVTK